MTVVRVAGWATPRSIIEEDDKLLFEVAEDDGCLACQSRIAHVRRTLSRKNITVEFRVMPSAYSARCLYVVLDPPSEGADIKQYVASLLDLSFR